MGRARTLVERMAGAPVGRRELALVGGLMALGLAVRAAYVLVTWDHTLAGDEIEYDLAARLFADGKPWWSDRPFGELHPTAWKAPLYPLWLGMNYFVNGDSPNVLLLTQALIGPLVILLVWVLARRLFDSRVAVVAAAGAAIYPHMWQWEGRLYPEALALPLGLILFLLVLERTPSKHRAALAGAVVGVSLLVRPTSFFLFAVIAVAFITRAGLRRGTGYAGIALVSAVLVVAPWTIRNAVVLDGFLPISLQDMAVSGTFNDDAATDPNGHWAWRPNVSRDLPLLRPGAGLTDLELRNELQHRAVEYVKEHPSSVPKAFYWNGIRRTWNLNSPRAGADEAPFEGRPRSLAWAGLAMYYVLLVLALAAVVLGLYAKVVHLRREREVAFAAAVPERGRPPP